MAVEVAAAVKAVVVVMAVAEMTAVVTPAQNLADVAVVADAANQWTIKN